MNITPPIDRHKRRSFRTAQRVIKLQFPTACERCQHRLAAGQTAWWSKGSTRCHSCGPLPMPLE